MLSNNLEKHFNWKLGLALILVFGVARFGAVLFAIESGNSLFLSALFILMIILPFVTLNSEGRRCIGISKTKAWRWLGLSVFLGILICCVVHLLGLALYQDTISNWFVYIGKSYPVDLLLLSPDDKTIYFVIFVIIGMTFSPFGEELFYRGLVHESLVPRFGERGASIIDSAAFAITHLAHFGLVYEQDNWDFLPVPAIIWLLLIFLTGLLFNFCKTKTGSIWGAIVCHMGFNVAMTYFIFYHILL